MVFLAVQYHIANIIPNQAIESTAGEAHRYNSFRNIAHIKVEIRVFVSFTVLGNNTPDYGALLRAFHSLPLLNILL